MYSPTFGSSKTLAVLLRFGDVAQEYVLLSILIQVSAKRAEETAEEIWQSAGKTQRGENSSFFFESLPGVSLLEQHVGGTMPLCGALTRTRMWTCAAMAGANVCHAAVNRNRGASGAIIAEKPLGARGDSFR